MTASNGFGTSLASAPVSLTTTASTTTTTSNTSYIYGDLLFGGTAPIEQITTSSTGVATASFLASSPSGVQVVYSSNGAVQEQALYSLYGTQHLTAGSEVTPFGFQGSYQDSTGLVYLINRYYDPTTDQFLSVDPKVSQTDQPYVFTNDSPLNATDPLGLSISGVNGESCISLSACSNPSVQARNQAIWHAASSAAFWAGVNAYLAMQRTRASAEHSSLSKYTSDAGACSNQGCDIVDPLLTYGGLVAGGAGVVLSVASAPVSVPIEVAVAAFAFGLTGAAVDGYECGRRVASACPGAAMGAVAMAAPLGGGIAMFATSFAVAGWIYDSVSTFGKQ